MKEKKKKMEQKQKKDEILVLMFDVIRYYINKCQYPNKTKLPSINK